MSIATFLMWAANWMISQAFSVILATFGGGITFGFFGVMCIISAIYAGVALPETKDKSLEEMEQLWA